MPDESKNGMQCVEFDALLGDALDSRLTGPKLADFQAHARVCPVCGPLLAEAEAGRTWLKSLQDIEPPAELVRNILVATSGIRPSLWQRFMSSVVMPAVAVSRQPRFAMSFGMAFFSISLTLSLAGVRVTDIRHLDLRPSAIKRAYYQTSAKITRYYENIRLVYEVESRVREFKRATTPPPPASEDKNKKPKDNTSGQPDQKQQRNYSQGEGQPVLAFTPDLPPVGIATTYRRQL
ncbi:MAG TPA: hypothetical protein VGF06_02420 [Terriglobales bacterium]|jgi:hypothetical protein